MPNILLCQVNVSNMKIDEFSVFEVKAKNFDHDFFLFSRQWNLAYLYLMFHFCLLNYCLPADVHPEEIIISTRRPEVLSELQNKGIQCTFDNQKVKLNMFNLFNIILFILF